MTTEIERRKITCPKCKGKGEITKINWDYGMLFPMAALFGSATDTTECTTCCGRGWIYDRD